MTGTHGAFQRLGHRLDLHPGLVPSRIHHLSCGSPDEVHAERADEIQVTLKVTGVFREVFVWAELGRVDENGHDHMLALGFGPADQREMPLV